MHFICCPLTSSSNSFVFCIYFLSDLTEILFSNNLVCAHGVLKKLYDDLLQVSVANHKMTTKIHQRLRKTSKNRGFSDNNATASLFSFEMFISGLFWLVFLYTISWLDSGHILFRLPGLPDMIQIKTQNTACFRHEASKLTGSEIVLGSTQTKKPLPLSKKLHDQIIAKQIHIGDAFER